MSIFEILRPVIAGLLSMNHTLCTKSASCHTDFLIRKPLFCLSLNFLNIILKNQAEIFLTFSLTCISLFYLIIYLLKFNTNNKRLFLTYMLTHVTHVSMKKMVLPLIMKAENNFKSEKKQIAVQVFEPRNFGVLRLFSYKIFSYNKK